MQECTNKEWFTQNFVDRGFRMKFSAVPEFKYTQGARCQEEIRIILIIPEIVFSGDWYPALYRFDGLTSANIHSLGNVTEAHFASKIISGEHNSSFFYALKELLRTVSPQKMRDFFTQTTGSTRGVN